MLFRSKPVIILDKELSAVIRAAGGTSDEALRLAKEAADVEQTMSAPSGPVEPIKPALELYGELLLDADKPADAAAAFEQSLLRTPKRTPSLLGLARSLQRTGNTTAARQRYAELAAMPGAAPTSPAVQEAQKYLKSPSTDAVR